MEALTSRLFIKKMKIIGLTGGIGSGKTKILNVFKAKGVPCYEADLASRKLIDSDPFLISEIKKIFGSEIYLDAKLDRKKVADIVFNSPEKLKQLNALVHPVVAADFDEFLTHQKSHYVIKEAAILFETGGDKKCNASAFHFQTSSSCPYLQRLRIGCYSMRLRCERCCWHFA